MSILVVGLLVSCPETRSDAIRVREEFNIYLGEGLTGKISAPEVSKPGLAVTVTVTGGGYIATIDVTSLDDGDEHTATRLDVADEAFSFIMPEDDVEINATFTDTPNDDASLTSLLCEEGTIVQSADESNGFLTSVFDYTVEVEHDVDTVHFLWTTGHIAARGTVNGQTTALAEGVNDAAIAVTAQSGLAEAEYTVKIVKKPNLLIKRIAITGSGVEGSPLNFDSPNPLYPFIENVPLKQIGYSVTVTVTTADTAAGVMGEDDFSGIASKKISFAGFSGGDTKAGTVTIQKTVNLKLYEKTYELSIFSDSDFPATSMATGGDIRFVRTGPGQFDELHIFRYEEIPGVTSTLAGGQRSYELAFTGGAPDPAIDAEVLVVAGGGGGGAGSSGGGQVRGGAGGAGGVIYYGSDDSEGYTKMGESWSLDAASYTVKVGVGGNPAKTKAAGANGIASIFAGTMTAVGGGGGGGSNNSTAAGRAGGSGGGGFIGGAGGAGTAGQGNPGIVGTGLSAGGSGGGAGGTADGVIGGPGITLHIEGYEKTYAEGGSRNAGMIGTPGTGTGGSALKAGGSGIVLVRFTYVEP